MPNNRKLFFDLSLDRRKFLKASGTLAGAVAAGDYFFKTRTADAQVLGENPPDPLETEGEVRIRYSVCQMCHSRCGVRAKVVDGVLVKLDGNPYHPSCVEPDERLLYSTPVEESYRRIGRNCAKSQAAIETLYNPYRIGRPLKRVGPRGSGRWEAVSWDNALDDIARKLREVRDNENDVDPNDPALGKRSNQVVFSPGRIVHGQKEFSDRIFYGGFGTINNRHDHTSICETSHHVGIRLATEGPQGAKGKAKTILQPDVLNSEFIILFGANPLEANFPMQAYARKLMEFKKRGGRLVVVDPRFSNTAAKADRWVPIKPGTDSALAQGMARWIIENNRHDTAFLRAVGGPAAGERSWTSATYLVKESGGFLRADEAGLGGTNEQFVVLVNGQPTIAQAGLAADLDVEATVNNIRCSSAFRLFRERMMEKSLAEYEAICGVEPGTIATLAREFTSTSNGKKASADHYRGAVQNTNGTYSALAVFALNTLIGNFDHKGGLAVGGGGWSEMGGKDAKEGFPAQVRLNKSDMPNAARPTGVEISRAKARYESTAEFRANGYPARRPWFPFAYNGNYQEVIPSIGAQYPYPVKVLITLWNAWPYSTPALRRVFEETVRNERKVELFVAIDTEMGETSAFADYILPETTFLERWATPHTAPIILTKTSAIRQPVVGSFDDRPWNASFDPEARNDYRPILPNTRLMEDILIDLARRIDPNFPGVGSNALPDGSSINNAWDYAKKMIQNLVSEVGSPASSVAEALSKGGVFENPSSEYEGDFLKHRYASIVHLYIEPLALQRDSMTGQLYDGLPRYEPVRDAMGEEVNDRDYPFRLVTYKPVFHAQARTAINPSLMRLMPTNFLEISSSDAGSLGIRTGDRVRVISPSGAQAIGQAKVIEGIRPGVVAIAHSYGHWEIGSKSYRVDGQMQPFDPDRASGIAAAPLMRLDPVLGDVTLQDSIGGSASFYDTQVRVEKVS